MLIGLLGVNSTSSRIWSSKNVDNDDGGSKEDDSVEETEYDSEW